MKLETENLGLRAAAYAAEQGVSEAEALKKGMKEADYRCRVGKALESKAQARLKIRPEKLWSLAEREALKKGMEEKSREFTEKGGELYAKA